MGECGLCGARTRSPDAFSILNGPSMIGINRGCESPFPIMTPTRHPLSSQPLPSQWPGSSPPPVETPKSYPISTPPFSSSPSLSSVSTQTRLSASPDLFDELNYSESMDDDFRRIDVEVASIAGTEQLSYHVVFPQPNEGPLPAAQEERTWVVFNGKVPGIYDCW
jgi:hypothetical protein